ncbi:hypothetical protein Scep_007164 [Stephania cephalantha]|uniref:PTC1-like winged helix-turn-helix domain-containing protein n=1 Tax=Stephania cephalantha TaxID=152367 RepID=A0AAP0K9J4_9MAGN
MEPKSVSSARQQLPIPDTTLSASHTNIEIGRLYKIDHNKLPTWSPIQLTTVRVVMVTERTDYTVTVNYPSNLSLRKYLSNNDMGFNLPGRIRHPDLDEEYVMQAKLAREALIHQVSPPEESAKKDQLRGFWLVTSTYSGSHQSPLVLSVPSSDLLDEPASLKGKCWSALNCPGSIHWGARRKVTFLGRYSEKAQRVPSLSSIVKDDEEVAAAKKTDHMRNQVQKVIQKKRRLKRSRHGLKREVDQAHENKSIITGVHIVKKKSKSRAKLKDSYDRWSEERYKSAEVKMLEIMKEKGAVHGKPVLRQMLRTEARKHIGDTGLLDHLLKHMAGKVAPNGEDRFRRRHNADGAMEYWLESADLVNIRREAGVNDPYWTPPPGWKLGDSPSQDPICAKELRLLREEMAIIRKNLQELIEWKGRKERGEKQNMNQQQEITNEQTSESKIKELEKQVLAMTKSLERIQEESTKQQRSKQERCGSAGGAVVEGEGEKAEEAAAAAAAAASRAAKRQRLKSGFRICKPQGTFLWPNMGANSTGAGSKSSSVVVSPPPPHQHQHQHQQVAEDDDDDLLMVPTPPSVSSSSSNPSSKQHQQQQQLMLQFDRDHYPQQAAAYVAASPVRPVAEKRALKLRLLPTQSPTHHAQYPRPLPLQVVSFGMSTTLTHDVLANNPRPLIVLPPHHHQPPQTTFSARGEGLKEAVSSNSTTTTETPGRVGKKQGQRENDNFGSDTWLALATPSPS